MTHGKSLSLPTAAKKLTKENAAPNHEPFGFPLFNAVNKAAAELAKNAQTVLAEYSLLTTLNNGSFKGGVKSKHTSKH